MGLVRTDDKAGAKMLIAELLEAYEPRKIGQTMALAWLGGALAEAGWLKEAQRMPDVVAGSKMRRRIDADIARQRFASAIRAVEQLGVSDRVATLGKIASALSTHSEARARETFERARTSAGDDDALVSLVTSIARVGYLDMIEQTIHSIRAPRSRAIAWSVATKLVTECRGKAPEQWLAESELAIAKCPDDQRDELLMLLANAKATCKQDAIAVVNRIVDPTLRARTVQNVADIMGFQGDIRSALRLLATDDLDEFMKWLLRSPLQHFWEAAKVAAWVVPVWEKVRAIAGRT
jgi:hypothetical protein